MKKIICYTGLSVLLFLTINVKSQDLGVDSGSVNLSSLPDTINLNDIYTHTITIINYSSTPLTGNIYLMAAVDTGTGLVSVDTVNSIVVTNFGQNDTIGITYTETYDIPNNYKVGGNIVVVWPIADFGFTHDSLYKDVYINYPLGINQFNDNQNKAIVYPNPTSNKIYFKNLDRNKPVKQVRIYGINGQLIYRDSFSSEITLEAFNKGVYFLEIEFDDNQVAHYKVIKE
jgi:hypothetical protein